MMRRNLPGSLRARCDGDALAYAVSTDGMRVPLASDVAPVRAMAQSIAHRLAPLARRFRDARYGPATSPVVLRSDFWRLETEAPLDCATVGSETPRSALRAPGWISTGRGLALLDRSSAPPVTATLDVPDGAYAVDLLTIAIPRMPAIFGFTDVAQGGLPARRTRRADSIGARPSGRGKPPGDDSPRRQCEPPGIRRAGCAGRRGRGVAGHG